jgi:hypothetical protein
MVVIVPFEVCLVRALGGIHGGHLPKWMGLFMLAECLLVIVMWVNAFLLPRFLPRFAAYRNLPEPVQTLALVGCALAYLAAGLGYFFFIVGIHAV